MGLEHPMNWEHLRAKYLIIVKLVVIIGLIGIYLFFPIAISYVKAVPDPDEYHDSYVFDAKITEKLAETIAGTVTWGYKKLTYFKANALSGDYPSEIVVLLVNEGYTEGISAAKISIGMQLGIDGALMSRDVYFGDEYLFFDDLPSIHVDQIKTGVFWPTQSEYIQTLYFAPFSGLIAPYLLIFGLFLANEPDDEWKAYLFIQTVCLFSILYLIGKYRQNTFIVSLLILGYFPLSVSLGGLFMPCPSYETCPF